MTASESSDGRRMRKSSWMKVRERGERRKIRRKKSGMKVTERSERRRITRKRN